MTTVSSNTDRVITVSWLTHALYQARRTLSQKGGAWTEEDNSRLVKKMDVNHDEKISVDEFVIYFSDALPKEPAEFQELVNQVPPMLFE